MTYDLADRLVVGIASSALFDLRDAESVFRAEGEEAYRRFQEEHLDDPFEPGVAFSFVKRLLSLNDLSEDEDDPLVEVMILSRNNPDTGLRVMRSVAHYGLPISRAIFRQGRSPYEFMTDLNMSLFLSADAADVRDAVAQGLPAGQVVGSALVDDGDRDLRIAFDFDGVLADDEAEQVFEREGLTAFHRHEDDRALLPLNPGPLSRFLGQVNRLQQLEQQRKAVDPTYRIRIHVAIVTARNAPALERAMASLKSWGVTVNDAFFLGGIDKGAIMRTLRPHIFFDDHEANLSSTAAAAPSVHVPFGVANE